MHEGYHSVPNKLLSDSSCDLVLSCILRSQLLPSIFPTIQLLIQNKFLFFLCPSEALRHQNRSFVSFSKRNHKYFYVEKVTQSL